MKNVAAMQVWSGVLLMAVGRLTAQDDPFAPIDPFAPVAEQKAAADAAQKQPTRFVLETHTLKAAGGAKPQSLTFQLDTASGDVWRFDGKALVRVIADGRDAATVAEETGSDEEPQEQSERDALWQRMEKIIIPEVNFKEARPEDVMRFLQDASREYDPEKKGVSFVRLPEAAEDTHESAVPHQSGAEDVTDPFAPVAKAPVQPEASPTISFAGRYMPLCDVLNIITCYANMKWRVKGGAVLWSKEWLPSDLKTRTFWLSKRAVSFLTLPHPSSDPTANLRALLSDLGIEWPAGTSVTLKPDVRALVVVNTRTNLEECRRLLAAIDTTSEPGRFVLSAADSPDGARVLVLTDSETGETWRYQPAMKDGADENGAEERFVSVEERAAGGK